jgi:two-component system, sensor histidine kinase
LSDASRVLILNVDDTEANRYVKTRILRNAGYDVVEAGTVLAAMRALSEHAPALVLLDVRLPDGNGRELCARIKADPAMARILVLQTSASHVDSRHRVASLDAGADGYLVEPMESEELIANVRALLRLRQAENERQAALDALVEADRRKDEFLAMLGHELRNPLAPIRNAVEILRVSEDRGVRERAREMVGRQVQHLSRLVDDLLDVSRISKRKIALRPAVVEIAAIVQSAVEIARPVIDAQSHDFEAVLPQSPIWLRIDAVRIAQAIGNLLHNAAKFTPPGGRIRLEARRLGDELLVSVEDNGMGLTADHISSAFDLFTQGERSLERSQGGLGIGLSLVKGLVEMHGGRVGATSPGPGLGSTFTIRLPLAALEVPAPGPREVPGQAAPGRRRILVVEDNLDAAESMKLLLEEIGHEVTVVTDGAEAVEVALRIRPDVVLLDIGLPGMDGFQLAAALRLRPETQRARLIAVSGYGQEKDRERSSLAGFTCIS